VLQANISKMWARLHPRCRANAVWLYNQDVEPQFDGLNLPIKNVAGTENVGGIANNVWNAEKRLLKGRPVIPVEYCATLGTVGDIILADLGMYATGVQGGVQRRCRCTCASTTPRAPSASCSYVDGQPWLAAPLTPYKGSEHAHCRRSSRSRPADRARAVGASVTRRPITTRHPKKEHPMRCLVETRRIEAGCGPVNTTGAAVTGAYVSMKDFNHLTIIIQQGAWAGGTPAVTLKQATAIAGTGAKALSFA
jgi:hypothetical protein